MSLEVFIIWKFLSGSIHLFSGTDNAHGSLSSFVMVQSHARPKGNKINPSFEDRACVVVPGSMYFLNCSLGQSNILSCLHLFYEGEKNKNKASKIVIPPFIRAIMQYFTVQCKHAFSMSQVRRNQEENPLRNTAPLAEPKLIYLCSQRNLQLKLSAVPAAFWCAHVTHDTLLRSAQLVKQQTKGWVTCSPQPHQENSLSQSGKDTTTCNWSAQGKGSGKLLPCSWPSQLQ